MGTTHLSDKGKKGIVARNAGEGIRFGGKAERTICRPRGRRFHLFIERAMSLVQILS